MPSPGPIPLPTVPMNRAQVQLCADMVIQRILRHSNVSTTATYYIKTAADDVRKATSKLENKVGALRNDRDLRSEPSDPDTAIQ